MNIPISDRKQGGVGPVKGGNVSGGEVAVLYAVVGGPGGDGEGVARVCARLLHPRRPRGGEEKPETGHQVGEHDHLKAEEQQSQKGRRDVVPIEAFLDPLEFGQFVQLAEPQQTEYADQPDRPQLVVVGVVHCRLYDGVERHGCGEVDPQPEGHVTTGDVCPVGDELFLVVDVGGVHGYLGRVCRMESVEKNVRKDMSGK